MLQVVDKYASQVLDPVLGNKSVRMTLAFLIVLYGSLLSPNLSPQSTEFLSTNVPIRIFLLVVTLFIGTKYPTIAVAVAFVFLMYLEQRKVEKFEGPNTMIYPGCMKMTAKDLLESFDNEKDKLLMAMEQSKIPVNIQVSDYFAPLIATYLLNRGYKLKAPCEWPPANK